MAKYRLLEISDNLINDGKPYWVLEKKIWGLWWSEYFEEHSEYGNIFFKYGDAVKWYNYHTDPPSRTKIKVLLNN